jgi:acetyl esterase/lipase
MTHRIMAVPAGRPQQVMAGCYRDAMRSGSALLLLAALLTTGCLSLSNRYRQTTAQHTGQDLPYRVTADGVVDDKHRLDIWSPATVPPGGAPVVIFVHGGYWRAGDRHYFEPVVGLYGNVGVALAEQGIVAVIPSYRLFPEATSPEQQLDDIADVIKTTRRIIRDHGGDPSRIVLSGHSAGGHLAALLATKPGALSSRGLPDDALVGAAPISGIYDVVTSAENADPPELKAELWDPFFGPPEQKLAASSLQHFGVAAHPPMLFVIGEHDFKNCLRDHKNAEKAFADRAPDRASFHFVKGNTHEDMVLEIGTPADEVTPALAAFVHRVAAR